MLKDSRKITPGPLRNFTFEEDSLGRRGWKSTDRKWLLESRPIDQEKDLLKEWYKFAKDIRDLDLNKEGNDIQAWVKAINNFIGGEGIQGDIRGDIRGENANSQRVEDSNNCPIVDLIHKTGIFPN